jgi:hypothetical protein
MDFHDPCDKDKLTGCTKSWLFAWVQKVCRVVPGGCFLQLLGSLATLLTLGTVALVRR